ncbi:MAG TPA: branched-chain amino acid ABC transporter permease [Limnochordales bacterium]
MDWSGIIGYGLFFLTYGGIYAISALGLNVQWGYTGLFNIGVGGFFLVGAYTSAIMTKGPDFSHLGGFGQPFLVGVLAGGALAALLAFLIGIPTLRLRGDYLAIATIGIAETLRLIVTNEQRLTAGVWGIGGIPKPLLSTFGEAYNVFYAAVVLLAMLLVYFAIERGIRSPWGRVLKAIREDEAVAQAVGKNVFRFKLQALVLGAFFMGVAGALFAHFVGYISPEAFEPMNATFLVWVMLIVGGSGNSKGAMLGAFVIWAIWSGTEFVAAALPPAFGPRAHALRIVLIGLLLMVMLLVRPQGVLGEERQVSKLVRAGSRGRPSAAEG